MISQDDLDAMKPQMPHEKVGDFIKAFNGSLDPRLWIKLIDEERVKTEILYRDRVRSLDDISILLKETKKSFMKGE